MENATKALLIAAAILMVMLLISLTMFIVNSNSDTVDNASTELNSIAVQNFNDPFLSFFSSSATANEARALTKKVSTHNAAVNSSTFSADQGHIFLNYYPKDSTKITHKWRYEDLQKIYNQISDGAKYKISDTNCTKFPGGYHNGYIICISITEL